MVCAAFHRQGSSKAASKRGAKDSHPLPELFRVRANSESAEAERGVVLYTVRIHVREGDRAVMRLEVSLSVSVPEPVSQSLFVSQPLSLNLCISQPLVDDEIPFIHDSIQKLFTPWCMYSASRL